MGKQLKVLLPSSFHKLPISDELAGHFHAGGGGALVVSSFGKVWHVEVGRDGGGAFLGRGWPEFVGAHGFGVGWFLVLRHQGRGVLAVKAFDATCCLKELDPVPSTVATRNNRSPSHKPQFIKVLKHGFMEKMIPPKFLQQCISEANLSSQMAVIACPLGKFWRIELEKDGSRVLLAGGWSQLLVFHGISQDEVVLFRYEGNMVFKIKVFGLSGRQKDFKAQDITIPQNIEKEQETPSSGRKPKRKNKNSSGKWKMRPESKKKQEAPSSGRRKNEKSSGGEKRRPDSSITNLGNGSYKIGPPNWIKKEISTYILNRYFPLPLTFCNLIGFNKHCTITLKTSMNSTSSWQVRAFAHDRYRYLIGPCWKSFCQDNRLKEGDVCTFNIVKTMLWHVVITRRPG